VRSYLWDSFCLRQPSPRTISPITLPRAGAGKRPQDSSVRLVYSLLHLSSPCAYGATLAASSTPDAPPLAGSLPFGVRTFLPHSSFKSHGGDRPTCSLTLKPFVLGRSMLLQSFAPFTFITRMSF